MKRRQGSVASLTALATFQNIMNRLAKKLIIEQILVSFLHVDCSLALSFKKRAGVKPKS
jgi:hypothetical protein